MGNETYSEARYAMDPEDMAWQDLANCRGVDPELFFPKRGESTGAAKAVCEACDVSTECLEFALISGERFGIWGGLSERERRRLRPAYNRAQRLGNTAIG